MLIQFSILNYDVRSLVFDQVCNVSTACICAKTNYLQFNIYNSNSFEMKNKYH